MSKNKIRLFNQKYAYVLTGLITLLSIPFAIYALKMGSQGFRIGLINSTDGYFTLNSSGHGVSNNSLSLHLFLGAFITLLAPIQVMLGWSRKAMVWHKWIGFLIVGVGIFTGIGGLIYIAINGTIGGPVMNLAFSIYGMLMILAAFKTGQYARNKQIRLHEEWAMRLFILAVASWLYRLGYGMCLGRYPEITETIGMFGTEVNFRGSFDYFMDFAFFILPLLGLEIYFRYAKKRVHPILISIVLLLITSFFIYGYWGFFVK